MGFIDVLRDITSSVSIARVHAEAADVVKAGPSSEAQTNTKARPEAHRDDSSVPTAGDGDGDPNGGAGGSEEESGSGDRGAGSDDGGAAGDGGEDGGDDDADETDDREAGEAEGEEAAEGDEEEEEEEEEPEDLKPKLEAECAASKQCAPYKDHYDHCIARVTQQMEHGKPKEDCVEEFFHITHCATQCAAPKLFAQLK